MVTRRSRAGLPYNQHDSLAPRRSRSGNTLVLVAAITVGVLVALFIFALNFTRIIGGSQEHTTAIEAAALAAARDLSRIVVEDPNIGFISLSDYPPIGPATRAADGQPLPVYSINTVMGTARLDTLVANALDDETMKQLARRDVEQARQAAQLLTRTLEASLQPGGNGGSYQDVYANAVAPYDDAKQAYQANQVKMSGGGQLVEGSFKLTLGWLSGGSTTITPVPQPGDMAEVPSSAQQDGNYRAYTNIPADGVDFYFCGVASVPTLRDARQFLPDDGVRIPSAVKVEADHTITSYGTNGEPRVTTVHNVACAEPGAINDHGAPGVLSVAFPSGPPPGISKLGDLIQNSQLQINKTVLLTPPDGDYPTDSPVLLPTSLIGPQPSISQVWASGFYHWVKNAGTRPNLKDLKNLQDATFSAMGPPGNGPQALSSASLMPPAYADNTGDSSGIETGILSVQPGTPGDPRLQSFLQGDPQASNAYTHMASYDSPQDILPSNSLMVSVTADGQVMSADGKTPLNTQLIHSFWARMAESNASGLAALAMGTEVARQAQQQIDAATAQIGQLQNTVGQLNTQLQSGLLSADQATQVRSQAAQLSNQIAQLNSSLSLQKQYLTAGQNAVKNGTMVASVSDSIIQNQRSLTAGGLSQNGPTFVLDGVQLVPHPVPPASLDAIRQGKAPSGDAAPTDWTAASGFYFYTMPTIKTSCHPATGSLLPSARAQSVIPPVTSRLYLFEFDDQGHVNYTVLPTSPFVNSVASQKQNLALSVNAMTTSGSMPIVWSMAFRDECVRTGRKTGGKHAGQPIASTNFDWCESTTYGTNRKSKKGACAPNGNVNTGNAPWKQAIRNQARQTYLCGGLAVDFQILNPIVTNCGFPSGTTPILSTTRATTLTGIKAPGTAASLNAFGLSLPIPSSQGLIVRDQPGPVGPGTTLAPGSSVPTSECPAAPPDLL